MDKAAAAADWLFKAHTEARRFEPLPEALTPRTPDEAYAIQDDFVALRAHQLGAIAGYKIALSTRAMQKFVGVDRPQAGVVFESRVLRSPARVRRADFLNLVVEFEIAVEVAEDLAAADAPFSRERVARAVGAVMPAFEIADDRNADYAQLKKRPLELIADNCWNEGVVLGAAAKNWKKADLAKVRGVASVNGKKVGEGVGADALGHPFDAVAWVCNHLASLGRGLLRGEFVITGSIVTSKFPNAGDALRFELEGLGAVELRVD